MRIVALVLIAVLAYASYWVELGAVEAPIRGITVQLTPQQIEQCRQEGGCVVVSKKRAQEWRADAFQAGVRHQLSECRRFL